MAREKKSEKLEVRLTHREKAALQLEAKASNQSESHVRSQPYWALALRPVRKHPRISITALAVGISMAGFALFMSTNAYTKDVGFEVLGSMETVGAEPRSVRRFMSRLDLNENGRGVHDVPPDHGGQIAPPNHLMRHRIEVEVVEDETYKASSSKPYYSVALRILREQNNAEIVVAEPALLTSINSITNLDITSDDGVRYALTVRVIP